MRHLSAVRRSSPPKLVESASKCVSDIELSDRARRIYRKLSKREVPSQLRQPIRLMPLSSSIGMGFEYSFAVKQPTAHLDQDFMGLILGSQRKLLRPTTIRYFALSAIAHAFIKDSEIINRERTYGDDYAMIKAWKWGGRLALDELALNEQLETELITDVRQVAKTYESDYAQDMLFSTHQAVVHGIDPPKLKPVNPWIGLAYPEAPTSAI